MNNDFLLKKVALYNLGEKVFGNQKEFERWLGIPFYGQKQCPYEFLKSSEGIDILMNELNCLAEGYPV
ncbi:MAG: MbcA/ParS/Xre antitoxin family protein [Chitinophagaceae bacterium]|nr:MbcA/ParS/Xre antitoxin family protein [Chitinophagaceae bacterium]